MHAKFTSTLCYLLYLFRLQSGVLIVLGKYIQITSDVSVSLILDDLIKHLCVCLFVSLCMTLSVSHVLFKHTTRGNLQKQGMLW